MDPKKTLLGAHISIEGGIEKALYRGESIDCNVIQIFTHSNRRWDFKPISTEKAELFKKTQNELKIGVIVHTSYLINLGSNSPEVLEKSITALTKELEQCKNLGIKYLILHPGSSKSNNAKKCMEQIANSINYIFNISKNNVMLLLENTAGQKNHVGYTFEQLNYICSLIKDKKRIGICLDTCHAWAAGYNFSTKKDYEKFWNNFNSIIGLQHLKVIHLNDSKKELNSRVDRHAEIGEGTMGIDTFKLIMNDQKLELVPKILETPCTSLEEFSKNIKLLKSLIV